MAFPTDKWLRLRDALAVLREGLGLDSAAAKQELCDCVIARKLLLRGERDGRYVFFSDSHEAMKLIPSRIDWRAGRIHVYDGGRDIANLRILNDEWLRSIVLGQPITAPSKPARAEPPARSRGGRPEDYPWDDIWIEVCRYIHYRGLPPTQAELMRHLQQWCENRLDKQPGDSTLKPKLRKLYEALHRDDEN
jgi:hypothetical protein